MIDRRVEPKITDAVNFNLHLPPYQFYTLDNGVPVYAVNAGEQDVISIEWIFFAGNSYEHKTPLAAATNYLIKNGTTKLTAFQINEHFENYGAYLNRTSAHETASVTLHCLTRHLPNLLPVAQELFTDSIFPEEELSIFKQNQKQRLEVSLKKCDFVANRLIDEYVYGFHHPYGKYTKLEDYDVLQQDELRKFYADYYTNGKCIMLVAGNLPKNIIETLNKHFGSLPFSTNKTADVPHKAQPSSQKKYRIVNDEKGVQGAVRLARSFPNRHHPDFMKVQVLNTIFGGYFGSRLMSNIREDKGYTYGIHSYLENHVQQSAWQISTEAGRDVCEATVQEVYNEMELLRTTPVDEEELHLVKNFLMGSLLGDLDGPFHIISRWKSYIINGLTEEYFYNSINNIRNITAEELQQLAKKYLQPNDFYELVVI